MRIFGFLLLLFSSYAFGDSLYLVTSMVGPADSAKFGSSVTGIGDFNQDGYDDVAVGAPRAKFDFSENFDSAGVVYIFFGGSPMDSIPDLFLRPSIFNPPSTDIVAFGDDRCIVGGGDLNGDSIPDIVVGAPLTFRFNVVGAGATHVYFGGTHKSGDTLYPDITLYPPYPYCWYYLFGAALAMGDLNNDGYDDLCIGAPNDDWDAKGRMYIEFGGSGLDSVPDTVINGKRAFEQFGRNISIGDLNGDGYEDLIVGAPATLYEAGPVPGNVYIYFGSDSLDVDSNMILQGEQAHDCFGEGLSYIDDLNGDGFGDIVVGAPDDSTGGTGRGKIYLFLGSKNMDSIADFVIHGDTDYWCFGFVVCDAGDMNKDSYSDICVEGHGQYIYFGDSAFDTIPDVILPVDNYKICRMASAGDVNNDGYADIIFGAPGDNEAGEKAGKVYIYTVNPGGIEEHQDQDFNNRVCLLQAFPTIFSQKTCINYQIPKAAQVTLKVYNLSGQLVRTLIDRKEVIPGTYKVYWDGRGISSGIYFCRLSVDEAHYFKKVILIQ